MSLYPTLNPSGRYDNVDFTKAAGYTYPPIKCSYLRRDVLLFVSPQYKFFPYCYEANLLKANAIGVQANELHFLYELHTKFAMFPTFPMNLGFKGMDQDVFDFFEKTIVGSIPGTPPFDPKRSVDGEKGIEILKQLPTSSYGMDLQWESKVIGVYDKGREPEISCEAFSVRVCQSLTPGVRWKYDIRWGDAFKRHENWY